MENSKQPPLFGQYAGATLERCMAIFKERGNQYADTMRECSFLTMRAVAKELGLSIPDRFLRILCIASYADMKHARMLGGYKEDTAEDCINYLAFVAEEMRQIKAGTAEPSACNFEPKHPINVPDDTF